MLCSPALLAKMVRKYLLKSSLDGDTEGRQGTSRGQPTAAAVTWLQVGAAERGMDCSVTKCAPTGTHHSPEPNAPEVGAGGGKGAFPPESGISGHEGGQFKWKEGGVKGSTEGQACGSGEVGG